MKEPGQPVPPVHVPYSAAFQRRDDVGSVRHDERPRPRWAALTENEFVVDLCPDRHHQVAQANQAQVPRAELVEDATSTAFGQCGDLRPWPGEEPSGGATSS